MPFIKGYKPTKETRNKISEALKGENNGMYGKDPWNKGKTGVQISWNKGLTKETSEGLKNLSESMKGENNPMYGKIFSDEHLKKMSESMKGCIAWNKGKTGVMPEPWNKGKTGLFKHTEEHKRKMSESMKGENHYNWKGGISAEPYCDVWIDKEYKESIKERDNYTCQNPFCLCDNSNLCVHHVNYVKKDCKPNNLITLCNSSNSKANKDRWMWQDIYERVIK